MSDSPKPPPPNSPTSPNDLDEVERALSVLKGRHPEHERAEREAAAKLAARKAQEEAIAHQEGRRARWRSVAAGAALVVVAGVGAMVLRARQQAKAMDAALEELSKPFIAAGFTLVESSTSASPDRLETTAEPGCSLALATANAPIAIQHGPAKVEGNGSILWCSCTPEPVVVTSPSLPAGGGLRLVRTEGRTIGGPAARVFFTPRPAKFAEGGDECAAESFDGWLEDKRYADTKSDQAWLKEPSRAALAVAGFGVVATAASTAPFAVVEAAPESCFLAVSRDPADKLSLRLKGGERPIKGEKGTIAWCDSAAGRLVVERQGRGELVVIGAPSAKVGGLLGLREMREMSGLAAPFTTWLRPEDLAWDAAQGLKGAAIPASQITSSQSPDLKSPPDARVVSLSLVEGGTFAADAQADVFSYCAPPLDAKSPQMVCVHSGPHTWRPTGPAAGGIAQAPLPFWMLAFKSVNEPVVVKIESSLLALARRLGHARFEVTTLEGVTDLPTGVDVLGRNGEDAIVAVGLLPQAPWAFPYTDGEPWTLEGEPRIVPLAGGAHVELTSKPPPSGPKEARRTVVFRRQAAPPP